MANLFRYCAGGETQSGEKLHTGTKELSQHGISVKIIKECPESESVLVYDIARGGADSGGSWDRGFPETEGLHDAGELRVHFAAVIKQTVCAEKIFPWNRRFSGHPLEDVIGPLKTEAEIIPAADFGRLTEIRGEARHRLTDTETVSGCVWTDLKWNTGYSAPRSCLIDVKFINKIPIERMEEIMSKVAVVYWSGSRGYRHIMWRKSQSSQGLR